MESKKKMEQIEAEVPVWDIDGKRVIYAKNVASRLADAKQQQESKYKVEVPSFEYFLYKQIFGEKFEYNENSSKYRYFPVKNPDFLNDDVIEEEVDSERLGEIKRFLETLSPMIKDGTKIISRIKPKDRGPKR